MKKTAFVFPGQGSQKLGMLQDISEKYSIVINTFDSASEVLGYDLWAVVLQGPVERLNQTEVTQPALLAAEVALWKILQQEKVPQPSLLAGHSLGEYTALCCAGVIDFVDAIDLVATRGRLMQQAVADGVGAMGAIIGLDDDLVRDLCHHVSADEHVGPANYNSIGQVVISGHTQSVLRVLTMAKEQGAKLAKQIPVSVPAHSELMRPAAEELRKKINKIKLKEPKIPVIHNVDVMAHSDPADISRILIEQLYSPVRWVETIQLLSQQGVEVLVECGPGKVLAGLNKRITGELTTLTTDNLQQLTNVLEELSYVTE